MAQDSNQSDPTRELYSTPGASGPARPLSQGVKVNNRYLIERELGRGGIGVVYLARDERLHGMHVVIKFLLDDSTQSAWLARKFMQEAEALTRISHPGVVRVIDRDKTEDGKPFFVMEFIKGRSLRSVMTPEGIELDYAAMLIKQIGQALTAAHCEGVFHRDLKPENIMLETLSDGDEHIKLIDFGIAKVRDSQSGTTTDVGMVAGSLNYMAPEQLAGQPVSAASDLYSFGVIAYELITGRRPFTPDSRSQIVAIQQLMTFQRGEHIVPPQQLRPSLSDAAQTVLLTALSFDPEKRPQDSRHFGDELARALTDNKASFQPTVVAPTWPLDPKQSQIIPEQPTHPQRGRVTERATEEASIAPSGVQLPSAPQATSGVEVRSASRFWMAASVILALLVVGGLSVLLLKRNSTVGAVPPTALQPGSVEPTSVPDRAFTYSVTVRQDPKHHPDSKPFQLPGEIIFSPGDLVRFTFSSRETGFLYIINESPTQKGAEPLFNILFPSPTSNGGSALIDSGKQIQIPERGEGFQLDAEEGVEKLWLVWSGNGLPELDALKRWANPQDRGEIKDSADVTKVRNLLASRSSPAPDVKRDDESRQTTVSARSDIFVKLVKLEHHQ
jgi:serine/threonine protein kinase